MNKMTIEFKKTEWGMIPESHIPTEKELLMYEQYRREISIRRENLNNRGYQ